jgi:hypothetical protein
MLLDLFPTKVIVETLSKDIFLDLAVKYSSSDSKDWKDLLADDLMITNIMSTYYEGKYIICDGWVRSGHNSFNIHCDNHYGNQFVCIVQLFGDQQSGGELVLYDPSWRNPQWMSDNKQADSITHVVPFIPGQVIIFPSNVWHSVTEYSGNISRITLNLMIRRVD